jgi:hypothetical protein
VLERCRTRQAARSYRRWAVSSALGDQTISDISFYNLTLGGSGNKLITPNTAGSTIISNVLTINTGVVLNNQGNQVLLQATSNGIVNNGSAIGSGKYSYEVLDGNASISGNGTFSNLEIAAVTSTNATGSILLSNPTVVTGILTLTEGVFSNGNNLTLVSGSTIKIVDGSLGSNPAQGSVYDITYVIESGVSRTMSAELLSNVRDMNLQIPAGATLNLGGHLNIGRNLTIGSGTLDVTSSNYNITVGGDFTNNGNLVLRNNTVTFKGAGIQTVNGTSAQSFYNLSVNNASGGSVQLNTAVNITNGLTLLNGIITSSETNLLSLGSTASVTGGSSNSFISGPLRQTLAATNGTKTFPVGKSGYYKPAVLILSQNTSTPTMYTAEVFDGAPPARTLPSSLKSLSNIRYYSIHSSDNSNLKSAVVSLTYDLSDQITDYAGLRIAKSYGTEWLNIGGTASSTQGAGTITSNPYYSFSDFVFGTESFEVLPLTWISFNAVKKQNGIELAWKTASEVNTSHFLIERSADGAHWKTVANVKSKGQEMNDYAFTDMAPLPVNYYRIKQVDVDDAFSYSKVVMVQHKVESKQFAVHPNPVKGSRFNCYITDAEILSSREVSIKVFDISGRNIYTTIAAPTMYLPVECSAFNPGIYVVVIQAGNKTQQAKFIRQ